MALLIMEAQVKNNYCQHKKQSKHLDLKLQCRFKKKY
jgi:hypothetical protein